MSRVSRKVQREQVRQARKAFRLAIKDKAVADNYRQQFERGYEAGYSDGVDSVKAASIEDDKPYVACLP